MRQQLNNNPAVQIGAVALLLVVGAIFLMTKMGGGESAEPEGGEVSATVNGVSATGATPGEAVEGAVESLEAGVEPVPVTPAALPPVKTPESVVRAFDSGATVALLFVREGGIDDSIVRSTSAGLASTPGVSYFVVPADKIARYTSITSGIGVNRVPALIVLTPKRAGQGTPTGSVLYGYQTSASVHQAIIDAGYKGPTLDYHP